MSSPRQMCRIPDCEYGEKAQVDFGEKIMRNPEGRAVKVYFFSMVFMRSRYKFIYFQNIPFTAKTTAYAHHLAFNYFGGMPQIVVYDQDKKMLFKENYGDYIMTEDFAKYVAEAGFEPIFCMLNENKVEEEKFLVGYFANLEVNLKLTPIEANEHYRLRDEQEKSFEGRKTRFNFDRLRCSSEESLRGREFILFVASILLSHWRDNIKSDKALHKKYPTEIDVLEEMRSIRYIKYEGDEGYITPFVGAQLELCRLFNIDIPEGCKPASRK